MVEYESIARHYRTRNELLQVLQEDKNRTNLIKLSVLQIVTNNHFKYGTDINTPRKTRSGKLRPDTITEKDNKGKTVNNKTHSEQVHEYEVTINKLKLEHTTTSKLQEAKIQSLKEENAKLKLQIKNNSSNHKTNINTSFSSIFTSSKSRPSILTSRNVKRSSGTTSRIGLKSRSTTENSPVSFALNKPIFEPVSTPVKKSKLTFSKSSKSINEFSPTQAHSETTISTGGARSSSAVPSSPTRPSSLTTSTPSKYMSTFDKSDNSSSPEFSPNRSQNNTRNLVNDVDNSETGGFVSANTNVENSENERSGDPKKNIRKTRKLQLAKSAKIERVRNASLDKKSSGILAHGLDDDELNPLKYYEDSNFKDVGLSPPTKRKHSEPDNTRKLKVRKKKNIFSIE